MYVCIYIYVCVCIIPHYPHKYFIKSPVYPMNPYQYLKKIACPFVIFFYDILEISYDNIPLQDPIIPINIPIKASSRNILPISYSKTPWGKMLEYPTLHCKIQLYFS